MSKETPLQLEGPRLPEDDLREAWHLLKSDDRLDAFRLLVPDARDHFFLELSTRDQLDLLHGFNHTERRLRMRLLAPDDAADLVQEAPVEERPAMLEHLDETSRREVTGLLAYAEDDAGGLMSPRFARVRPDMTVDEAFIYLKRQARERVETIYYIYVLDTEQRLLGVVSFRDLFRSQGQNPIHEVMNTDLVSVPETMDQEAVGNLIAQSDLIALPVLDAERRMKGIVTVDDLVDVFQEEASEDIQKIGGSEALHAPYLDVSYAGMLRKRAIWLVILFLGGTVTAIALARFEEQLTTVVAIAFFVPLIIASGGNSGSQAATLVIRAMSLGEVRRRDWRRIFRRELAIGLTLGAGLGLLAFLVVMVGGQFTDYKVGSDFRFAMGVATSLVAVVIWGVLSGAMLPLGLRQVGFDPASASAPLVATLVDVTGLAIYFIMLAAWLP